MGNPARASKVKTDCYIDAVEKYILQSKISADEKMRLLTDLKNILQNKATVT